MVGARGGPAANRTDWSRPECEQASMVAVGIVLVGAAIEIGRSKEKNSLRSALAARAIGLGRKEVTKSAPAVSVEVISPSIDLATDSEEGCVCFRGKGQLEDRMQRVGDACKWGGKCWRDGGSRRVDDWVDKGSVDRDKQ